MDTWRLLTADGVGAADGLAFDEAMLAAYHREATPVPPTLRLYTYRSHCALVGRYQDLPAEVDLEACAARGAQVSRRATGGGAIIMGSGQLGIALATRAPARERPRELLARFADGVCAGLRELGVEAAFHGTNDLEVGGRKIAGLGLYVDDDGGLLFHASVLADLDVPLMLSLLRVPAAKLADKAVTSVEQRITTVSRETGRELDGASLREVIGTGFAKAFVADLAESAPTAVELAATDRLAEVRYRHPDWLELHSPAQDVTGTALLKTPAGLLRVYVSARGTTATSVLFAGDLVELPGSVRRLEGLLRWGRLEQDALARAVCDSGAAHDLGCPPQSLVDAVLEAGRRIQHPSHPVRPQGSCYYPDAEGDPR